MKLEHWLLSGALILGGSICSAFAQSSAELLQEATVQRLITAVEAQDYPRVSELIGNLRQSGVTIQGDLLYYEALAALSNGNDRDAKTRAKEYIDQQGRSGKHYGSALEIFATASEKVDVSNLNHVSRYPLSTDLKKLIRERGTQVRAAEFEQYKMLNEVRDSSIRMYASASPPHIQTVFVTRNGRGGHDLVTANWMACPYGQEFVTSPHWACKGEALKGGSPTTILGDLRRDSNLGAGYWRTPTLHEAYAAGFDGPYSIPAARITPHRHFNLYGDADVRNDRIWSNMSVVRPRLQKNQNKLLVCDYSGGYEDESCGSLESSAFIATTPPLVMATAPADCFDPDDAVYDKAKLRGLKATDVAPREFTGTLCRLDDPGFHFYKGGLVHLRSGYSVSKGLGVSFLADHRGNRSAINPRPSHNGHYKGQATAGHAVDNNGMPGALGYDAGLVTGDRITHLDGTPVPQLVEDFTAALDDLIISLPAGATVTLTMERLNATAAKQSFIERMQSEPVRWIGGFEKRDIQIVLPDFDAKTDEVTTD